MKALKPGIDIDSFFRRLAVTEKRLLLLDYDGTLAPFTVEREKAVPYPGVRDALQALLDARGSRLVLISGRTVPELIPLLGLKTLPEIWGSHGWERVLQDHNYVIAPVSMQARQALEVAQVELEGEGLRHLCEVKPGCVALHWRGRRPEEIEALRVRFRDEWSRLAARFDLSLIEFDGGLELCARGRDKAFVVNTLLTEMGPGTVCAFLGDDATDENAFQVLEGDNLGILVRTDYRPTAARVWMTPPGEILEFLHRWTRVCRFPNASDSRGDAREHPSGAGRGGS